VEKIEDEFRAVIPSMKSTLIINQEYPSAMKLVKEYSNNTNQKWFLYGEKSESGPHNVETFENSSSFEIKWKGEMIPFKSSVVGGHNVLNITSCILYLLSEGF